MSAHWEHLPQESDHVSTATILVLAIIGGIFLMAGFIWPWTILLATRPQYARFAFGSPPRVVEPHPEEFGGLLQSQIEELADQPSIEPRTTYRWVDRDHRLVEMPVEDAMELWLARNGVPTPAGGAPTSAIPPAPFSTEGGAP